MKNVILCGFPCSGKDTVGAVLKGKGLIPVAFGEMLKNVCGSIRSCDYISVAEFMVRNFQLQPREAFDKIEEYSQIPRYDVKDRILLQTLGTDFRKIKNDIWTAPIKNIIISNPLLRFVITDCRRHFELEEFNDCFKVYVEAADDVIYKRLKQRDGFYDTDILTREAEKEVPELKEKCDYILINNTSKAELVSQIQRMWEAMNA